MENMLHKSKRGTVLISRVKCPRESGCRMTGVTSYHTTKLPLSAPGTVYFRRQQPIGDNSCPRHYDLPNTRMTRHR